MIWVAVMLGSDTDGPAFVNSGAIEVLDKVFTRAGWRLSVLSAHRHKEELEETVRTRCEESTRAFIGAAGLLPALPGDILANLYALGRYSTPVFGVALGSDTYAADKGTVALNDMPKGCPVLTCGSGPRGFVQAAVAASQIVIDSSVPGLDALHRLTEWHEAFAAEKPPQPDVNIDEFVAKHREKKGGTA